MVLPRARLTVPVDGEASWGADTPQGIGQMDRDGEGLTRVSTWNLPSVCVSVWLASHRRAFCLALGNGDSFFLASLACRIVSLTLDSSTGSSFTGGLYIYDPSSPHALQSLYVAEPGVVTDWDVDVCDSGNLHFDACPPTLPGASTAPAGAALPVSVHQSPQHSPADHSTSADAEAGALRGDPLNQADARATTTIVVLVVPSDPYYYLTYS